MDASREGMRIKGRKNKKRRNEVYRNKSKRVKKMKGTERRKGQEQETTKMVKKKWDERRRKKKPTSVFVLLENAQSSVASYLFPFTFYSSTFSYISPVFLSRAFHCLVPSSLNSLLSHVSPYLRLWSLYSHFSKIILIINLRHQRFY